MISTTQTLRHIGCALLVLLFAVTSQALASYTLSGKVVSPNGTPILHAEVALITPAVGAIATTRTDNEGAFHFPSVAAGSYVLRVTAPGLAELRIAVRVGESSSPVVIQLDLTARPQTVTVTAERGIAEETHTATQQVNVISQTELAQRAKTVVAQAAQEEEGVHLQRTSPTISGIFVRGLTGTRVNVYVDGVRYSTSAMRGGINTFFNMNQPGALDSLEIMRGPSSAQYGSDGIGGTVQLVSAQPSISDRFHLQTRFSTIGSYADASFGSNLQSSAASKRFGGVLNLEGLRANQLRPGQGVDSHSAFTRFFGLPSDKFIDSRLPGTAFTQYGGSFKFLWLLAADTHVSTSYTRSQQDGARRYDQLLGGDGNLIADLRNLMGDLFYVRLDQYKLKFADRASVTYSYNAQREERVNQGGNGNALAAITHEPERMRVHGVQGFLDKLVLNHDLLLGAEYYDEAMRAPSFQFDPATQTIALRRGRVPDGAAYKSGGMYLQDSLKFNRFLFTGTARYSAASYRARQQDSPVAAPKPLWPSDSLRVNAWTWRAAAMYAPVEPVAFFFNAGRGFRTPHITDLGTLGLTGSGFEVAAPDVAGLGATVGTTAARTAVTSGVPVTQLKPEFSMSFDGGVRIRTQRLTASFSAFVNDIQDSITKQALILPAGAVGTLLGSEAIVAQDPGGAVFVASSASPVLVRTNWDDARIWGLEHRARLRFANSWDAGIIGTYIHAADRRTGLAPNFEGGTPAPDMYLTLRYSRGLRWWVEPYIHMANRQDRLSTLDLEDRRTGATRSRSNIQNFFRRGATVRGYVSPGADGVFGNADDTLIATGENLAQIQTRVLGAASQAPLYDHVPGYVTFNVRGGYVIGERQSIFADFENIADRNYRGISWGVDAPGRNLTLRYTYTF